MSDGKFKKGQDKPGRGKSFKNKLLDVIRSESLLSDDALDKDQAEAAYLKHVAARAFDDTDKDSGTLLKELLNKSYPGLKASLPEVHFELPEGSTPLEKAEAILKAVSGGDIPPDVGVLLIQASKHIIDIEMGTELKERMAAIEKELGINV